jgi:hypothetical protein
VTRCPDHCGSQDNIAAFLSEPDPDLAQRGEINKRSPSTPAVLLSWNRTERQSLTGASRLVERVYTARRKAFASSKPHLTPNVNGPAIWIHRMPQDTDTSNAAVRPPVAWILALAAGLAADRLYPLRFVPASVPGAWVGGIIFAIALALAIWAIVTIRKAGTQVETYKPTTAIVANGPTASRATLFISAWCLA